MSRETILYTYHPSPVGRLLLAKSSKGLLRIEFENGEGPQPDWVASDDAFGQVIQQLDEYFRGERKTFDLQLDPRGTPFQLAAWEALIRIPYGETRSYAQQAEALGNPKAVRAVGGANGRNPLPIVVPCHRVIGKNGRLTGFGGGLPIKEKLLALESGQLSLSIAH